MVDLMQTFTFASCSAGDNVFEYGDQGSTFYVIIKGTCSVLVRNPQIREWYSDRKYYKRLVKWKEEKYDPKINELKKQYVTRRQMKAIEENMLQRLKGRLDARRFTMKRPVLEKKSTTAGGVVSRFKTK